MHRDIPGFNSAITPCPSGAQVFTYYRINSPEGSNVLPVLLLLHGFPQNNLMWKEFATRIPSEWNILIPDLPGYGDSTKPVDENPLRGLSHSKREWAKDIVHVVNTLCSPQVQVIAYGHDRGARLAYRMATDFPGRVVGLAVLDIVPTCQVWHRMRMSEDNHAETMVSQHWVFLANQRPFPEEMILSNSKFFFEYLFERSRGRRDKLISATPPWLQDSMSPYLEEQRNESRVTAACEDYRAGLYCDVADDLSSGVIPIGQDASYERTKPPFTCPILVLSSVYLRRRFDVDKIWRTHAETPNMVQSFAIGDDDTGHYLVNEALEETLERTLPWLGQFTSNSL